MFSLVDNNPVSTMVTILMMVLMLMTAMYLSAIILRI